MKKTFTTLFTIALIVVQGTAQTNIKFTDPLSEQVLLGNYDPATYKAATVLNHPDTIAKGIHMRVSPDSLKSYLIKLGTYYTRNTGSDTVSNTRGIGAARRWIHSKFQEFNAASGNRMIVSYLQFDASICGMSRHRNVCAVLPGLDTSDKTIIIIEGHFDSRCESNCDVNCKAHGIEDNASGTALVMELARVMSKYSYNHTIMFMPVTGEEQGLYGGKAMAQFAKLKNVKVKAVLNNDVIGGIICGKTSSPPSCPGENHIDSMQVRIFSRNTTNSPYKQFARFIKLEYKEEILPMAKVPMKISIMAPEDRTGRGGDHIPFGDVGITAVRFSSANEHGNASAGTGYTDRQHTTRDTLGVDTNGDLVIDSFFVDFNYLARNAVINGNAAGMAAIGPKTPDLNTVYVQANKIRVDITQQQQYKQYRIGVRTGTNIHDWDSVYTMSNKLSDTINVTPSTIYFVSVASVDSNGVESLFSREVTVNQTVGIGEQGQNGLGLVLLQNKPNPFDDATWISVVVNKPVSCKESYIRVVDISGKETARIPINLSMGVNDVLYEHGFQSSGTYLYSLIIDGKIVDTKSLVFAN